MAMHTLRLNVPSAARAIMEWSMARPRELSMQDAAQLLLYGGLLGVV